VGGKGTSVDPTVLAMPLLRQESTNYASTALISWRKT